MTSRTVSTNHTQPKGPDARLTLCSNDPGQEAVLSDGWLVWRQDYIRPAGSISVKCDERLEKNVGAESRNFDSRGLGGGRRSQFCLSLRVCCLCLPAFILPTQKVLVDLDKTWCFDPTVVSVSIQISLGDEPFFCDPDLVSHSEFRSSV